MPILSHSHKEAIVSAPIAALLEALFVMLRVRVDRDLASSITNPPSLKEIHITRT